MSIVRKQPSRLVLLGWVALTILVALTQTAFAYQDQMKPSSGTLKLIQTSFTYRGQLKEGTAPANGAYTFRFALYTEQSVGHKLGVVIKDDVVVTNGSFTAQLDFGSDNFSSNESWLEVEVRPANSADPYTALSPRQRLTPTRNAILAQSEPLTLIGVPLGFPRGVDTDLAPVKKTANQPVTVTPIGNTLTIASQDSGIWAKDGTTARLSTSTDNVGIGTTKPIAKLDVSGDIHASNAITVGNSVGLLSSIPLNLIEVDNSSPLAIGFSNPMSTTPNPGLFLNIKVGIGTTTPTNTLDVNGQARIRVLIPNPSLNDVVVADPITGVLFRRPASTLGGGGFWSLTGNAGTNPTINFLGTTDTQPLAFRTANTERVRIDTNGNVGIGTTTPTQNLTLGLGNILLPNANSGTDGNLYFGGITDNGQAGMRLFGGLVNASTPGGFIDVMVNPANPSDGLRFRVDTNNGGIERMRITASGKVGIGTAAPNEQLEITGNLRLPASTASAGVIMSGGNRFIHNFGTRNFFAGVNAGNLAVAGAGSTGVGVQALQSLTTGNGNTAVGFGALFVNTTGNGNTAVGNVALENTTGNGNTAIGTSALALNNAGSFNTALGSNAGFNLTSGSNNIYISNSGANENGTIRIGTSGQQTSTFISGIRGVTTSVANAIPVFIDSNGQLGTLSSSRRFKERIGDMGTASEVLYRLRPVSFLYKPEYGGRPDLPQFGLIAEEVAKVAPELVAYDDQGKPYTVNYQFLVPMLLNEMQKKDTEIEKLGTRLDALEKLVQALTKK